MLSLINLFERNDSSSDEYTNTQSKKILVRKNSPEQKEIDKLWNEVPDEHKKVLKKINYQEPEYDSHRNGNYDDENKSITVTGEKYINPHSIRKIAAHELGHYYDDTVGGGLIPYRKQISKHSMQPAEYIANKFANNYDKPDEYGRPFTHDQTISWIKKMVKKTPQEEINIKGPQEFLKTLRGE